MHEQEQATSCHGYSSRAWQALTDLPPIPRAPHPRTQALDYYCGIFGLLLIAIVLVSAVLFVEGPHNLSNRLHSLTGKRIPAFVSKGAWPLSLVLMTVRSFM